MKRLPIMSLIVLVAGLTIGPIPARAQFLAIEQVLLLPTVAEAPHEALAADMHAQLLREIVVPPGKTLLDRERVANLVAGRRISDMVADVASLGELASTSGAAFVVATILRERSGGGFELSGISFSREEREVINCVTLTFTSETDLRARLGEMSRELSKAANYSSTDSALFLSLILPGLGQILKEKPLHGLVSMGLFSGSLIYALTIPKADPFEFDRDKFTTQYNWDSQEYDYLVHGSNVGAEAYYEAADEDWEHHRQAAADRRLEEIRRKRATGLIVASYLFNMVDALVLTRKELDTRPFFIGLEAIPDPGPGPGSEMLRFQLRVTFR
jgi:hypothetical protein